MSEQQVQTQVEVTDGQSKRPCENQSSLAQVVEAIAQFDLIDRFAAWFGHWWHRPFWKADRPLRVFLENLTWTGHVRFAIPRDGDTTGYEAEVFLRNHGVYVWGRFFDCENVYFNVKKEQASWAEYLLEREGITTANAPVDPRNQVWAEPYDKAPPGWGSNRRSHVDLIAGILRPDVIASMKYRPKAREWPAGSDRKRGRRKPTTTTRRRRRTRKQQTTVQRLARQAGQRMNRRRPRRPRRPTRPGNHRQK
ncbi:MAG TPA: hypothetical protein ENK60_07775 [Anaerolineae bacterium]|nr:hypothetical protein [Anaerolineae bacterium]